MATGRPDLLVTDGGRPLAGWTAYVAPNRGNWLHVRGLANDTEDETAHGRTWHHRGGGKEAGGRCSAPGPELLCSHAQAVPLRGLGSADRVEATPSRLGPDGNARTSRPDALIKQSSCDDREPVGKKIREKGGDDE